MLDLMIDLETLGITPDSAILTVGIAQFDIHSGEIGNTLYRVIDLKTSLDYGFKINADTLYWWLEQSDDARRALVQEHNRESIEQAMMSIRSFIVGCNNPQHLRLWGNGPTFDNAMIRYTYEKVMLETFPIPFWKDRCVRTVKAFYPHNLWKKWQMENLRTGTFHNALDDAKYQVKYLCHILNALGVEEYY